MVSVLISSCENNQDSRAEKSSLSAEGREVFQRCAACHSLEKERHRAGPSLYLIFGRKSGSHPYFPYSKSMKTSNIHWDRDSLKKFLTSPRKVIPGNRMSFIGIKNENEVDALLDFLEIEAK